MYLLELAGDDDAFAAAEAGTAAREVEVLAPGLATAASIESERVRGLAFTRRASDLVGTAEATVEAVTARLADSSMGRRGSVAVRARDVRGTAGVDTQRAERSLGAVLVDRGLAVDLEAPDHVLRAVFADGIGAIGWLVVESERSFGARRPTEKPFFQPGSMDPLLARAVANLAGARSGTTLLDPMCGTAGILVEARLVGAGVVGFDAQPRMVRGARQNLDAYAPGDFEVGVADAARLPLVDDAVDAAVFDAPYGRQSMVASTDPDTLLAGGLLEARRVADRAVVVADADRSDLAVDAGWAVEAVFSRRVHRSLTRFVHVLGGG